MLKSYEGIAIEITYFDADIRTDIITASRWDVGAPDVDWEED